MAARLKVAHGLLHSSNDSLISAYQEVYDDVHTHTHINTEFKISCIIIAIKNE
jgi:hypothetical protein